MKKSSNLSIKIAACLVLAAVLVIFTAKYSSTVVRLTSFLALKSAQQYLPCATDVLNQKIETKKSQKQTETKAKVQEKAKKETTTEVKAVSSSDDFYAVPEDIQKLIDEAGAKSKSDKKDGNITEKTYINDGVTDKYEKVRVKNTNKTQIDVKKLLSQKADLSVSKDKPSVLIYHTHTTEAYQYLDRNFYAVGYTARSNDSARNMVRVGDEICNELEKAGYKVIHDKVIHDESYGGAYAHSRAAVEKYLKQYPSIQITLDVHRDAIEMTNGTKIKPVTKIGGKKTAQVMIISGCQEKGNPIENFPDWKYNLIFAVHLQNSIEKNFPSLTRPIFFCPRKYNMNLTRCSLLLEVGSDSNTLEEARFCGKCIGKSLADMLEDYTV